MNRFKVLPSTLEDERGTPLSFVEEIAAVIGMAAWRVKQASDRRQLRRQERAQRYAIAAVVIILVTGGLAFWWTQSRGYGDAAPWIVAGVVLALIEVGVLYWQRTRFEEQWQREFGHAAVTQVGRYLWPVGILPLNSGRAIVWDVLARSHPELRSLLLPEAPVEGSEQEVENAERLSDAFDLLLRFSEGLEQLQSSREPWPSLLPDRSSERLGEEVAGLWQEMGSQPADAPGAIIATGDDGSEWQSVLDGGVRLSTFFRARDELQARIESYARQTGVFMDAARDLLVDRHWRDVTRVNEERATVFSGEAPRQLNGKGSSPSIPIEPGKALTRTASRTSTEIRESLLGLEEALRPLERAFEGAFLSLAQEEEQALAALSQAFAARREEVDAERERLALLDSEILALAPEMARYHETLVNQVHRTEQGFTRIAEVPLEPLHAQFVALEEAINAARGQLEETAGQLDLGQVEEALAHLHAETRAAGAAWSDLAGTIPAQSQKLMASIERLQEKVNQVVVQESGETAMPDPTTGEQLRASLAEVEEAVRIVRGWTTAQEQPVEPLVRGAESVHQQLQALDEQRRKLAEANTRLAESVSSGASGSAVTLTSTLENASQAIAFLRHLGEETREAIRTLEAAAAATGEEARRLAQLLAERDEARAAVEARWEALRREEEDARKQVLAEYQSRREMLQKEQNTLAQLPETIIQRLSWGLEQSALTRMGIIRDEALESWPDQIVNNMSYAIEQWGERVAGAGEGTEEATVLGRLRKELEENLRDIEARSISTSLPAGAESEGPVICFVPFWLVETRVNADEIGETGTLLHLFPPCRLAGRRPDEPIRPDAIRFREISQRLWNYLTGENRELPASVDDLLLTPEQLSEEARGLDRDTATPPIQSIATALAQHWIFFRSDDRRLNQILQNSRDLLIPDSRILEATAEQRRRLASSPEGANGSEHGPDALGEREEFSVPHK